MRKFLVAATFAALALPAVASAQTACERDQRNHQTAGTVIGAGVGALLGSAIAGNSSNTAGTIVGGVAGAAVGNQMGRGTVDCPPGYYDPRPVAAPAPSPPPGAYDSRYPTDNYYDERGVFSRDRFWAGTPAAFQDRIALLDSRVDRAEAAGAISLRDADRAFDQIDLIRREARRLARAGGGRLSYRDEAYLQRRLDDVSAQVRWARAGGPGYYGR